MKPLELSCPIVGHRTENRLFLAFKTFTLINMYKIGMGAVGENTKKNKPAEIVKALHTEIEAEKTKTDCQRRTDAHGKSETVKRLARLVRTCRNGHKKNN